MAHNTRSANLSNSHDPAFQPSRTNAIHSWHTIPAMPHSPHYQATRHTIQFTIYNTTRSQLTALHYDMTHRAGRHRQAGRQAGGKESLFIWEARPRHPSTPHSPTRQLPMHKTPLPRKTPLFLCQQNHVTIL
jgi:hypothetical protein